MDSRDTLPDFENPPVSETVMDVGFAPLSEWGIPHFGVFWQRIQEEYPHFQDQSPIPFELERFDQSQRPSTIALEFLNQPEARCWFLHKSESRLIQVQNDRFIHNWRKTSADCEYPHYETAIRSAFETEWNRFCAFLKEASIGTPEIRQCEITYINDIENNGWESYSDLVDALGTWPGGRPDGYLPTPENVGFATSYLMQEAGRLRIQLQPAIRHRDLAKILQLKLTARGRPASSNTDDILKWFDLGREWIVRGFTDFTSAKMHQMWKRRI
jgi:uncharacterized protein (TIGR04255 family)